MNGNPFLLNYFLLAALFTLVCVLPSRFMRLKSLNQFQQIAHYFSKPKTSIITVFVLSFVLSASISSCKKPLPLIQDEFSYLLTADTFSHGRLTNSTHPFWKHFETIHVVHEPSYASKYPPGQGLFLAVGQVITGHPIVGVWLSAALASAAICWMLQAWVPPKWALLGGLISAIHPLLILWTQNFWGGSVAVLGGALLFGALRRVIKRPEMTTTIIFSTGLFLLAISRPFEGFLTAISAAILLVIWMIKQCQFPPTMIFRNVLFPLAISLVLIAAALAIYNHNVTGSISRLPYQVHEERYSPTPLFLWGTPRTDLKPYNPHLQRLHYGWSLDNYKVQQTPRGYRKTILEKTFRFCNKMFIFPLGVLLLMLPWIFRDIWGRIAILIVLSITLFHFFAVTFFLSHYFAPIIPLVFYILIQGMRHLRVSHWKDRDRGSSFIFGICILFVFTSITKIENYITNPNFPERYDLAVMRSKVIAGLKSRPQKDLIFVSYSKKHDPIVEWVYNRADIDGAEIVWAHDLGKEENEKLIKYYPDRKVWLMMADDYPVKLRPLKKNKPQKQNPARKKITSSET